MEHLDSSAITWLGGITLLAFVLLIWQAKKHNPDKEVGVVINEYLYRYNISIFLVAAFILNLAEAMMAASILAVGKQTYALNFAARFAGHMSLALLSLLGALTLTKEFKSFGELFKPPFKDNFYFLGLLLRLVRIGLASAFAFLLPILNALLIANGLHETPAIRILYADYVGNNVDLTLLLLKYNKPFDYEPWDGISYPMAATLVITMCHILIIIWDAAIAGDKRRKATPAPANPNPAPANAPGGAQNPRTPAGVYEDTLNQLLEFHAGVGDTDRAARVQMAIQNTANLSDAKRMELANLVHLLVERVKGHKANLGNLAAAALATEKVTLTKEIDNLFRSSPSQGKGFGMGLPRSPNV